MSHAGQATRAVSIAYAQRILSVLVTLMSTAVLSRLIDPSQFGYVAMATTVMNFLIVFRDFGLTSTTVQKPVLTGDERNSLFWMNALIVATITIAAVLIAPVVGLLYGSHLVTSLMSLAAAGFFLSGLAAQHAAVLRRAVAYEKIFVADFGGLVVGACASIFLAYLLRSAYALVLGTLAQSIYAAVTFYFISDWRPRRPGNLKADVALLFFGGHVAVFTAFNFLTNNIAALLLGMLQPSSVVGFYNRAQSLYELPRSFVLGPFLQVQFVFLCRDAGDPAASRARYLQIIRLTALMFIPAAMVMPIVSSEVVRVLLGAQWVRVADILSALMPALAALGVVACVGQFLTSLGKVSELRRWGYADFLIRGGGTIIGCLFGPVGAAVGFSLSTLFIATPVQMVMLARLTNVTIRDQVGAVSPGISAGIAAMGGGLVGWRVATTWLHHPWPFLAASTALAMAGCCWLGVLAATEPVRGLLLVRRAGMIRRVSRETSGEVDAS